MPDHLQKLILTLLETGQLCLIVISKGQFLLKKFMQGHKGPKLQIYLLLS